MAKGQKDHQLDRLIKACIKGRRASQEELYKKFYGYAMGICLRYAENQMEAEEILNDGFYKVFSKLTQQQDTASFKPWLRRTMVNAAIDHFRREKKHSHHIDIVSINYEATVPSGLDQLKQEDILKMVQQLSPAYRMVFVLYAIEGYKHQEIAEKLHINEGTSKSNLAKARIKLRKMLANAGTENMKKYG